MHFSFGVKSRETRLYTFLLVLAKTQIYVYGKIIV